MHTLARYVTSLPPPPKGILRTQGTARPAHHHITFSQVETMRTVAPVLTSAKQEGGGARNITTKPTDTRKLAYTKQMKEGARQEVNDVFSPLTVSGFSRKPHSSLSVTKIDYLPQLLFPPPYVQPCIHNLFGRLPSFPLEGLGQAALSLGYQETFSILGLPLPPAWHFRIMNHVWKLPTLPISRAETYLTLLATADMGTMSDTGVDGRMRPLKRKREVSVGQGKQEAGDFGIHKRRKLGYGIWQRSRE